MTLLRHIGPRDACRICRIVLRFDNESGHCRPHRYLKDYKALDPGRTCHAIDCSKPLRSDNATGYCTDHRYWRAKQERRTCAELGCQVLLRRDNTTGFCRDHIGAHRPRWAGPACVVPGCGHQTEGRLPLCATHRQAWLDSPQRLAAVDALARFLDASRRDEPHRIDRIPPAQLEQMADALLGAEPRSQDALDFAIGGMFLPGAKDGMRSKKEVRS